MERCKADNERNRLSKWGQHYALVKRTVEVSTPGMHLHLKQNSLAIRREGKDIAKIPLEDLGTLILGTGQLTVTVALLARLAETGGVTIVTGGDYQPEGALLPLRGHTTRGERIQAQVGASKPLQKQLWAALIRRKIENQASLLEGKSSQLPLQRLQEQVRSGDPSNCEAQAARIYWPLLFPAEWRVVEHPFRRRREGPWPNGALNYGYSILRGIVARAICGAGLLPEIGIHHHNRYDAFALASDVMEPFRPWVDQSVRQLLPGGSTSVDREAKQILLEIYEEPVLLDGRHIPLLIAVERAASSLAKAFLSSRNGASTYVACKQLKLPLFPVEGC